MLTYFSLQFKAAIKAGYSKKTAKVTGYKKLTKGYIQEALNYLTHFNGKEAARDAGFSAKTSRIQASQLLTKLNIQNAFTEVSTARDAGFSKKTAQEQASRLLSNVMVQTALAEVSDDRMLTKANLLNYLEKLVYKGLLGVVNCLFGEIKGL